MSSILAGKRIVVGVTGSIAAFKVAGWVSAIAKDEARVAVVMTQSAQQFVSPLTFSALSGEHTYTSMFGDNLKHSMSHIELGLEASVFLVAPATAHTISRLAHGMADDLLSTAILATKAPVIVCPAMNSQMYLNKATQENIKKLKSLGYIVIDPESGMMACKDDGPGRLPEWENVQEVLLNCLSVNDLAGEKVLVTAGPTREPLDPARFISNRSSGKMGYALARSAFRRGAEVTLISGPTTLPCPYGVIRKNVISARQMRDAVFQEFDKSSIIIKSAAVCDFRPAEEYNQKVKKDKAELSLDLLHNPDILNEIGMKRNNKQIVVGFAAESENIQEEGRKKLLKKKLDLIAVNDISKETSGFEVDTNKVYLIDSNNTKELPLTSKIKTADMIWDHIINTLKK